MLPVKIDHVRVPPIKCQGIKTKLINFITTSIKWDGNGTWIEPFVGSGAVVFNVQPQKAILSDTNPHIIKFYQDIQNDVITPERVREYLTEQGELLSRTDVSKDSYYYEVRKRFNSNPNSLDFLFLSRSCFNGMMRFNSKGGFNVPFCKKPDRFRQALVTKIVNQVKWVKEVMEGKDWLFVAQDWKETVEGIKPNDFLYLDPPYAGKNTDYFNKWTDKDSAELATIAQMSPAGYALSMWAENSYRKNDYLDQWNGEIVTQDHFYHVGGNIENRNSVSEAIIIKKNYIFNGDIDGIPVRHRNEKKISKDETSEQLSLLNIADNY